MIVSLVWKLVNTAPPVPSKVSGNSSVPKNSTQEQEDVLKQICRVATEHRKFSEHKQAIPLYIRFSCFILSFDKGEHSVHSRARPVSGQMVEVLLSYGSRKFQSDGNCFLTRKTTLTEYTSAKRWQTFLKSLNLCGNCLQFASLYAITSFVKSGIDKLYNFITVRVFRSPVIVFYTSVCVNDRHR